MILTGWTKGRREVMHLAALGQVHHATVTDLAMIRYADGSWHSIDARVRELAPEWLQLDREQGFWRPTEAGQAMREAHGLPLTPTRIMLLAEVRDGRVIVRPGGGFGRRTDTADGHRWRGANAGADMLIRAKWAAVTDVPVGGRGHAGWRQVALTRAGWAIMRALGGVS